MSPPSLSSSSRITNIKFLVVLVLLLTALSFITLWSSIHHYPEEEGNGKKFITRRSDDRKSNIRHNDEIENTIKNIDDNENNRIDDIDDGDHGPTSACSTDDDAKEDPSSKTLFFGADCSITILLKELAMLYEHSLLLSAEKSIDFCSSDNKKLLLHSCIFSSNNNDHQSNNALIDNLFDVACCGNKEKKKKIVPIAVVSEHVPKTFLKPNEKYFLSLLRKKSDKNAEDGDNNNNDDIEEEEEQVLVTLDTKTLVRKFKAQYLKRFVLLTANNNNNDDGGNSTSKFQQDFMDKIFQMPKNHDDDHDPLISQTRFTIVVSGGSSKNNKNPSTTNDDDESSSSVSAAGLLAKFIPKRFGDHLIETPSIIILSSGGGRRNSKPSSSLSSLLTSDLVIFLSSSSNEKLQKFEIIMSMLPGTTFIDVVATSHHEMMMIDVDAEGTCSLLGVEYVAVLGNSNRQGFLSSTTTTVKGAPGFNSIIMGSSKNKKKQGKSVSFLNDLLSLKIEETRSASDNNNKKNRIHHFPMMVSEERWFEVIKEAMATSYLRKYRLRSNVRQFDLRRN